MNQQKTAKSIIEYLARTASAESEEDLEFLLIAMSPTEDRKQMGEVYEQVLGYNPISYFDKITLRKRLYEICSNIKGDNGKQILDRADEIVDAAYKMQLEMIESLAHVFVQHGSEAVLESDDYSLLTRAMRGLGLLSGEKMWIRPSNEARSIISGSDRNYKSHNTDILDEDEDDDEFDEFEFTSYDSDDFEYDED